MFYVVFGLIQPSPRCCVYVSHGQVRSRIVGRFRLAESYRADNFRAGVLFVVGARCIACEVVSVPRTAGIGQALFSI